MNRIRAVNVYLVLLLAVPVWLDAQEGGPTTKAGRDRASLAQMFEQAFHEEGCANCRVWVSGRDNTTVEILDLEATTTANDYKGRPAFWYDAGFTRVIYYSAPGKVYAAHELPSAEPPVVSVAPIVRVRSIQLGSAIGPDRSITTITTAFAPKDTIYVSVGTEGETNAQAVLEAVWTYEKDGYNTRVDSTSLALGPTGPANTEFHISRARGLPVGNYHVEVWANGTSAGSLSFRVEAGDPLNASSALRASIPDSACGIAPGGWRAELRRSVGALCADVLLRSDQNGTRKLRVFDAGILGFESDEAALCVRCGGVWGDPFVALDWAGSTLSVGNIGGSRLLWEETWKFAKRQGQWILIGWNRNIKDRLTGSVWVESVNALTSKAEARYSPGDGECEFGAEDKISCEGSSRMISKRLACPHPAKSPIATSVASWRDSQFACQLETP